MITSANLTQGGLRTNYEFGLVVPELRLVPDLESNIQSLLATATHTSLEEIAETARKAGRTLVTVIEEPAHQKTVSAEADYEIQSSSNDADEEQVPRTETSNTEEELERIERFNYKLSLRVEDDAHRFPFGELVYFRVSATAVWHDGHKSEELQNAIEDDLSRVRSYIAEWSVLNNFPSELRDQFLQLFLHHSFKRQVAPNIFDPLQEEILLRFQIIGKLCARLHLLHNSFRGNYRWLENIGFFDIAGQQAITSFPAQETLEAWGANWWVHLSDLERDWQKDQFFRLIGLLFYHQPELAFRVLESAMNPNEYMEQGAFRSQDARTRLQEAVVKEGAEFSFREIDRSGEEHRPTFIYEAKALGLFCERRRPIEKAGHPSCCAPLNANSSRARFDICILDRYRTCSTNADASLCIGCHRSAEAGCSESRDSS